MSKARIILDLTAEQYDAVEKASLEIGYSKAMYLRTAVEIMNLFVSERGKAVFLKDPETNEVQRLIIPGMARYREV